MPSTDRILHQSKWRDTETLRVTLSTYKGRDYFGVRIWWTDANGELLPGKNGINVPLDEAETLIEAIKAGHAEINRKAPPKRRGGKKHGNG